MALGEGAEGNRAIVMRRSPSIRVRAGEQGSPRERWVPKTSRTTGTLAIVGLLDHIGHVPVLEPGRRSDEQARIKGDE